jgi:hypothetical protein
MTDVPDEFVAGGIENIMHCNSKLHNAEIRSEMAAVLGNPFDYEFPQFLCEGIHLLDSESLEVLRGFNFFDQHAQDAYNTEN